MIVKIFLVTMNSLPNDHIDMRLKALAVEASWLADHASLPDDIRPPMPDREYSWIKPEDDERVIARWREALGFRKQLLSDIGITIPMNKVSDEANDYRLNEHYNNPTFACTGDQLLSILEVDSSITVKSAAPVASDSQEGILERFEKVIKKLEALDIQDASAPSENIFNQHCDVHIPGNMLATYNETLLLEDSCTDELQRALNSGWRIVAVCPQSQRRPDYILGRFNPKLDADGAAQRSA